MSTIGSLDQSQYELSINTQIWRARLFLVLINQKFNSVLLQCIKSGHVSSYNFDQV